MKLNKFSLDLMQYLRANLVFSFQFKNQDVRNLVTVSTPIDVDFEIFCLEQAKSLVENMINTKYPTSIFFDLKCLDYMNKYSNEDEDSEEANKIRELIKSKS